MVQIIQSLDQQPISDLADKFVAGSQLGRQRKRDKLEQEDADWRKKKYEEESAKSDTRYADTKAREQRDFEQRDRFHQDEQTWRMKRLEIDAQARASAAQDHAAEWRSLFNEDPPDEVYGDVGSGVLLPHIDPRSDVPVEIQQMIHEHVANPRATAEDTRLLHQTAKQVALERAKGAVRRKIERWAQPDPDAGGGAGELRPEQILPGDRAKEWIKGLDDIKDPNDPKAFQNLDDINTKLETYAKDHRTQVVNRNARDQAVTRMNAMLDKVSQRDLEDGMGSSIPQESLDEMHQILEGIAQSGLGGNALQAAEERFATKLRQARTGGAGGTTSSKRAQPFATQHPSDQALEVWKGLEPGARTPEALDALELKYAQRALMAQQNAQMAAGKRAAAQSLPYETDLSTSSASPSGSTLPTGQAPDAGVTLPPGAEDQPPEKQQRLAQLKMLRLKGIDLSGNKGKISLEDGLAFVDGVAKPQDKDLKAERARLSEGYVSEREAAKIKEIDKRLPERAKERAEAAANEGIDEQFLKSAIERLPSTEKQWIDDMQRVEDLAKGNDGYAKKAKRLYSKLKEHGESKGWSRGTD